LLNRAANIHKISFPATLIHIFFKYFFKATLSPISHNLPERASFKAGAKVIFFSTPASFLFHYFLEFYLKFTLSMSYEIVFYTKMKSKDSLLKDYICLNERK